MDVLALLSNQDFLVVFLFTLAVVFGILRTSGTFGNNAAVQMVIAAAIAYFASTYEPYVSTLKHYFPTITWFFVAMFFIAFMLEIFGLRGGKQTSEINVIIYAFLLLVLISLTTFLSYEMNIREIPFFGSIENLILVLGIFFIAAIFWCAYHIKG